MPDVFGYYDTNRQGLLGDSMDPKYQVNDPAAPIDWQAYYQSLSDSGANRMTPGQIAAQAQASAPTEAQQFGDPSLGTDVYYGLNGPTGLSGPSEHFAPSSTPVTSFLSAGSNYADTGGMKSTNDPALISELQNDARVRGNQGILKIAALVAGGAAAGYSPWSVGGDGLTGVTTGGASYLPGGTEGFLGAPASEGLAAFPAAEGAGLTGVTVPSAGAYLPASSGIDAGSLGMTPEVSGVGVGPASSLAGSAPSMTPPASSSWLDKLNQFAKQGVGGSSGQQQAQQVSAPMMPQRSGGGFLQQVVKPRPNYLGRFGDAVMAAQNANNLLLTAKLFDRSRR